MRSTLDTVAAIGSPPIYPHEGGDRYLTPVAQQP